MFSSKKPLQKTGSKVSTSVSKKTVNPFIEMAKANDNKSFTANGAVAHKSTLDSLLDQFGKVTSYRQERSFADISKDMSIIFAEDKEKSIKFIMYLRLISRQVKLFNGNKTERVQNGQGLRHESIMRMIWLGIYHKDLFKANLELFVTCGSFKDIFTMMRYDLQYNQFDGKLLDWNFLTDFVKASLLNEEVSDLTKKYLPTIKSNKAQKTDHDISNTIIGRFISQRIFGSKSESQYRDLKSSGKAHVWQQLISKNEMAKINFNTISGRALALLSGGKFLTNNGLDKQYLKWIENQPVAKFTGYPYELTKKITRNMSLINEMTINKQFETLVKLGKDGLSENENGFIVALDSSGSMSSSIIGMPNYNSMEVAKSIAVYFSEMSTSNHFKNHFIEFDSKPTMNEWKGSTVVEKIKNTKLEAYGSTNFNGIADIFINIKNKGVSESDFPSGLLCISDGDMDYNGSDSTPFVKFRNDLRSAGFSKEFVENFKLVIWNIDNTFYSRSREASNKPFLVVKDELNSFLLSGMDASVLKFVIGTEQAKESNSVPKTPLELMNAVLDQEVLNLVKLK